MASVSRGSSSSSTSISRSSQASQAGRVSSQSSSASPRPGSSYQVKSGDNLYSIAKQAYGDGSRWRDIADANPGKVGENGQIRAGQTLQIPQTSADKLTGPNAQKDAQKVIGQEQGTNDAARVPEGDPALKDELNAQLQQAHQQGTAKTTEKYGRGRNTKKLVTQKRERSVSTKGARTFKRGQGWLDAKQDVADEADPAKEGKVQKNMTANATLYARDVKVRDSAWKAGDLDGEGAKFLGGAGTAKGEVHALHGEAKASVAAGLDLETKEAKVDVSGRLEGRLVGAEGKVDVKYGNDVISGKTSVGGKAYVGAEATGNVTARIGKSGVKVGAGIDAFAGAKAAASVNPSLGLAGENIGTVGVVGEAYAGVGVKAKGEVGFEKGHLTAKVELGASLGVGVGVNLNIDIDVVGSAKAAYKGAKAAANAVGDAASKAWNAATSVFW